MSAKTGIQWTESTWNPIVGCTKVSAGCDRCYAIRTARRMAAHPNPKVAEAYSGTERAGEWTGQVNVLADRFDQPFRWRKPRKIFVNAQSDLFHRNVSDEIVAKVFAVMALTPRHTYQILTKRHGRMRALLGDGAFHWKVWHALLTVTHEMGLPMPGEVSTHFAGGATVTVTATMTPLPNVWVGVSVEDQATAVRRIPALLATPAAVRWISCEPLLGRVALCRCAGGDVDVAAGVSPAGPGWCPIHGAVRVDWVVCGGESGPGARPVHPDWVRSLRDQCAAGGVPFFFKQWGDVLPVELRDAAGMAGGRAFQHPQGGVMAPVIRLRGPSGTFRAGETRPVRPGERTRGGLVGIDEQWIGVTVGKARAGDLLDGTRHHAWPTPPPAVQGGSAP